MAGEQNELILEQLVLTELEEMYGEQSDFAQRAQREVLGVIAAARHFRELMAYGPLDGAAHFGPDFHLPTAQADAAKVLDAALARYDALATPEGAFRVGELEAHGSITRGKRDDNADQD